MPKMHETTAGQCTCRTLNELWMTFHNNTAEVDPESDSGAALFKQHAQDAQLHGRAVHVAHAGSGGEGGGPPAGAEMKVL